MQRYCAGRLAHLAAKIRRDRLGGMAIQRGFMRVPSWAGRKAARRCVRRWAWSELFSARPGRRRSGAGAACSLSCCSEFHCGRRKPHIRRQESGSDGIRSPALRDLSSTMPAVRKDLQQSPPIGHGQRGEVLAGGWLRRTGSGMAEAGLSCWSNHLSGVTAKTRSTSPGRAPYVNRLSI